MKRGLKCGTSTTSTKTTWASSCLYLSSLCARADADAADAPVLESVADFIEKHPLSWVDAFRASIAEAAPDGYFVSLAGLARALLAWHAEALRV